MSVQCQPKLSDEMKKSLNAFHNELNLSSKYWENPVRAITIAQKYLNLTPDLEFIEGWGTPVGVIQELSKQSPQEKGTRGGKREGAGRKKKEPSVVIRVPESLADKVREMIERHKNDSN